MEDAKIGMTELGLISMRKLKIEGNEENDEM